MRLPAFLLSGGFLWEASDMAVRFTESEKWRDSWFSNLKPNEKLLFLYLCDNCNIAGIIEYNPKIWAVEIGWDRREIEGALMGLQSRIVWSKDQECIFIRNFLKHQKNHPLNTKNKAHIGILRLFQRYSEKFGIDDVMDYLEHCGNNESKGDQRGYEGGSKGDQRGTGIGIGIHRGIKKESSKLSVTEAARKFYDEQLSLSDGDENYRTYVNFLFGDDKITFRPLENVLSIKKQLLYKEFRQLLPKYKAAGLKLFNMTQELDNYSKAKYTSLYHVMLSWLNRRTSK